HQVGGVLEGRHGGLTSRSSLHRDALMIYSWAGAVATDPRGGLVGSPTARSLQRRIPCVFVAWRCSPRWPPRATTPRGRRRPPPTPRTSGPVATRAIVTTPARARPAAIVARSARRTTPTAWRRPR